MSPTVYILIAAFVLGNLIGGTTAWQIQGARLDHVQGAYDTFVATAKAEGVVAQQKAKDKELADQQLKEKTDREYQKSIANLHADIKRLRDQRTHSDFLPPASQGAGNSANACFDRGQLESALRTFDQSLQGLVDEGSTAELGLNTAREWATELNQKN